MSADNVDIDIKTWKISVFLLCRCVPVVMFHYVSMFSLPTTKLRPDVVMFLSLCRSYERGIFLIPVLLKGKQSR